MQPLYVAKLEDLGPTDRVKVSAARASAPARSPPPDLGCPRTLPCSIIQSYRRRYGNVPGDPAYDETEAKRAAQPPISVPTIVLHGEADGVGPAAGSEAAVRHFTGSYDRRVIRSQVISCRARHPKRLSRLSKSWAARDYHAGDADERQYGYPAVADRRDRVGGEQSRQRELSNQNRLGAPSMTTARSPRAAA